MKRMKPLTAIAFVLGCLGASAYLAFAATNIDMLNAGEKWGWNNIMGWLDMKATDTVMVGTTVQGYASSSLGDISFDCATMRTAPGCTDPDFKTVKDANGLLSGWAWNDTVGWISMSGTTTDAQVYQARVAPYGDGIRSYLRGWAWNDAVGWLDFDCLETGSCAANDYKTETSADAALASPSAQFVSKLFDLGTSAGVLNTVAWKGAEPAGSTVDFQIATGTATSTLTGDMGTVFAGSSWIPVSAYPASPTKLTEALVGMPVENRRYFRYRVRLSGAGNSPRIDDIMIGWSP